MPLPVYIWRNTATHIGSKLNRCQIQIQSDALSSVTCQTALQPQAIMSTAIRAITQSRFLGDFRKTKAFTVFWWQYGYGYTAKDSSFC
ncbi:hypothetical protein F2P81_008929 [Scophthalmus maximus]|uniref:Uncharacterized protein n=1 Tax=Scophthalmus maximus TaxID=52904 RepID=A0A6A4T077_SCOMX|nr:hypothetical protein F2P81_008929 [Scophthalmus maximus]